MADSVSEDRLWRQLQGSDFIVLGWIVMLWPLAVVLKRVLPLPRLARFFDPPERHLPVAPTRAARLIDGLLRRAYRHRPGYCVERSLILFHLLRRGRYAAHLCFGVRKQAGGALRGHAWVLLDGEPLAEAYDPHGLYTTTYVYPPASSQVQTKAALLPH